MEKIKLILLILVIVAPGTVKGYYHDTENLICAIIILSLSNLLMIVVTVVLIIILYKTRKSKNHIEFVASPKKINSYECMEEEASIKPRTNQYLKIMKNDSVISIISETHKVESKEVKTESPIQNKNPLFSKPKVEPTNIIKREQMDALVRDILLKTNHLQARSMTDLDKIISEGNKDKKAEEAKDKPLNNDNNDDDIDNDQYDTLPSPVPLQDASKDETDTVYDVIPRVQTTNMMFTEENYVLPITSSNDVDFTQYVNARINSPLKSDENKNNKEVKLPIAKHSSKENNAD